MKKFQFSMQKVLEYTEHMEDNEKAVLQGMRKCHEALCEQMANLRRRMENYQREYAARCADGIVVHELMALRGYIDELEKEAVNLLARIERSEAEIERQIDKIVGLSKEKESMDKLKDKHWETYQSEQRKQEEVLLEEFVANAEFASKQQVH